MNQDISYAAASKDYKAGRYIDSMSRLNQLLNEQRDARTYALLARNLERLNMKAEAASAYMKAAEQNGSRTEDYLKQALRLNFECGRDDQALALGNRLLPLARREPDLAFILASLLLKRGESELAGVFKQVLAGSDAIDHMILAVRLIFSDWQPDSPDHLEATRRILQKIPGNNVVRLLYLALCREHSKYDIIEKHQKIIDDALAAGDLSLLAHDQPFFNIHWTGNEQYNALARLNTGIRQSGDSARRRAMQHPWAEKIRIGYVSADFWDQHATMKLLRGVFELHDRDRFEVTLFCNTPQKYLALNEADRSAWGEVVSTHALSVDETVGEIQRRGIDILVDLKGYTIHNRHEIFNRPAAPVHAAWLGYPGSTTGLDLDYVIGDPWVLPESSKPWYDEKFCRLPECYQPNDPVNRPKAQPTPRAELGLPEDAFVFASFNANRKITVAMIETWAEILKRTPGSLLWIMRNNSESQANIARRFEKCGISPKRLVFMQMTQYKNHIDRIPAADLGLDTYPVNGHTTTSEQLWAGLPVITVKGTNFASRVSESLLSNIGLPELIAEDRDAYVALAVSLWQDRGRLSDYRRQIGENRLTRPLFDAERFTRHLEKAYETMAARARAGLDPDHLDIAALPPREGAFLEEEKAGTTRYRLV